MSELPAKVQPNQIWRGQHDAHSLIKLTQSTMLPYLTERGFKLIMAAIISMMKFYHQLNTFKIIIDYIIRINFIYPHTSTSSYNI